MQTKFRLWLPGLKKLSYDSFVVAPTGKVYILSNGDFMSGQRHLWDLLDIPETKDYVLSQFTGIQDVNKKDVYEGDIIKYFGPVIFKWGKFGFSFEDHPKWKDLLDGDWRSFEITGNIFENPELLK